MSQSPRAEAGTCPHIRDAVTDPSVLKKYKTVIAWNVKRTHDVTRPAKRRKLSSPTCDTCNLSLSRPFVCLHCSASGCWSDGHIVEHLNDAGHVLCADSKSGSIYCSTCDDFIYDPTMDETYLTTTVAYEEKQTKFQVMKKLREPFRPWTPNAKDSQALGETIPIPCQEGRRGLLNLGQTCFLNAILQALVHNPLLRNYFLSDKHNYKLCKNTDCTCCEMDKLFTEIYSPDAPTSPFGPTSILATTWRLSAELSGYAQQDAHEFFISALNQIHATSRGHTNVSCNCVIHSTFAGQLQSDVTCERCGNTTSTVDPMLDVSLELKGVGGENTLAACLRRFTHPEKLGPKEYTCSKCKTSHESSKRLSIRKLPPVLSFQFKRFEHKTSDKSSAHKIDTPIRFPAELDMAPYTTLVMKAHEKEVGKGSEKSPILSYPGPEAMYEYDLFAVVNHEGQIDNGHYTNFARFQDEWYRFDDEKVTYSSLGACLNSSTPAYMCFYVKRHLDYKPHMTPTYVLTRETEAVREKEMEQEKEAARMKEVEDALLATV
ncbi:hypothetical protein PLICRDRAFT_685039 [Plicaturopsis crispa FD-325 SS-3]|nr:hypothetical protein PLICRDRAFT_685039 [Plicaturopsis crispa FD-325 SS-3]